jgi:hypothetical protein
MLMRADLRQHVAGQDDLADQDETGSPGSDRVAAQSNNWLSFAEYWQ